MNKTHQVLRVDSWSGEAQKDKNKTKKKKKWIFGEAKMQIKSLSRKSSKHYKLETRNHDSVLMNWLWKILEQRKQMMQEQRIWKIKLCQPMSAPHTPRTHTKVHKVLQIYSFVKRFDDADKVRPWEARSELSQILHPKEVHKSKNQKARYGFFFIGLLEAVSMVIYIKHKVQKGDRAPRPILQRLRAQIQQ